MVAIKVIRDNPEEYSKAYKVLKDIVPRKIGNEGRERRQIVRKLTMLTQNRC